MGGQRVLHFRRNHRGGTGADHLFQPADDAQAAGRVETTEIAGVQPAVRERRLGRGLVLPISLHDMATADQNFSDRAGSVGWAVIRRDIDRAAGHRMADAGHRCRIHVGGREIGADRRFRHAVEQADARADEGVMVRENNSGGSREPPT